MTKTAKTSLRQWIVHRILTPQGLTWRELAAAVDMTESGLLRGVRRGSLEVHTLLRLSELADYSALALLRLVGKGALAKMLERRFGLGTQALSAADYQLLAAWHALDSSDQTVVLGLVQHFQARRSYARALARDRAQLGVPAPVAEPAAPTPARPHRKSRPDDAPPTANDAPR